MRSGGFGAEAIKIGRKITKSAAHGSPESLAITYMPCWL